MKALAALSSRERILIFVALPLAFLFAGHRFGWEPLSDLRETRTSQITSYRLIVASASDALSRPAASSEGEPDATPLAARVTQSAEAAGLSLSRLEPEGDRLRVTIAEAPFPQVILWISDLEAERGMLLAAVEMDRRTAPGAVSVRILVENAP